MMTRTRGVVAMVAALVLLTPGALLGQYLSEPVDFGGSYGDPASDKEMFRDPQFSGSTSSFIVANSTGAYDRNAAYRDAVLFTSEPAGLYVFFTWVDDTDPNAWLRLTTYDGALRPNPTLDLAGRVRFNVSVGQISAHAPVYVCIAVRETGTDAAQMADGGTSGDIEWVGVDTSTLTAVEAGANGLIESTPGGDDTVVLLDEGLPTEREVLSWGNNGIFESTYDGSIDDVEVFGAYYNTNGVKGPIPLIQLPVSPIPKALEFDLATGTAYMNGDEVGSGIVGHTGDGTLSSDSGRGTLEAICFRNVHSSGKENVVLGIDDIQFEATEPDPIGRPTIKSPIIEGDEQVTVTNLFYWVDQVTLYRDDAEVETRAVSDDSDVVFDISPAVEGQVFTATQRNGQDGSVSELSLPVTVVSGTVPYTFSILLDESGSGSCSTAEPGWEWVAVSSVSGWAPQGQAVVAQSGLWQVVDVPLRNPDVVVAGPGGDGSIGPSPVGYYTMDSAWFTIPPDTDSNGLGPWELLIDGVQAIYEDGSGEEIGSVTILNMEDGLNHWENARGQSTVQRPDFESEVISTGSFDGSACQRMIWTFPSTDPSEAFGILQRLGWTCDTSEHIPDDADRVRFHMVIRKIAEHPDVELPVVSAPILIGQDSVKVSHSADATAVQVYIDGAPYGDPVDPGGATETIFTELGSLLDEGVSVSATQTIGGETSDLAYPRGVGVPPAPSVQSPIEPGDTRVTVYGVSMLEGAVASAVTVYVNDTFRATAPAGQPIVRVNTGELFDGDVVTATQTVNGLISSRSSPITVALAGEPPLGLNWIETSPLPWGITDTQAWYLNGYVYAIGGRTYEGELTPQATDRAYYAEVQSDGSIGPWQETTPLPGFRAAMAGAAWDGKLYLWGGWDQGWPTRDTCYYATPNPDGSITSWTTSSVTIPPPDVDGTGMDALGRGMSQFQDTLYIINGEYDYPGGFGNSPKCWYSNLAGGGDYGTWIETTDTTEIDSRGSWFHGLASIEGTTENYLYRVAGNYRGTTESNVIKSAINPDGSLGPWSDVEELPAGRYEHACTVVDNKFIFAIGGLSGATPQDTVFYSSVDLDTGDLSGWRSAASYPFAVSRNAAVGYEVDGVWYILNVSGGEYSGASGERFPECYYTAVIVDSDGDGVADDDDVCPGTVPGYEVRPNGCMISDCNSDSRVDLFDMGCYQTCVGAETPDATCLESFDLNDDGEVDLGDWPGVLNQLTGP